MDTNRSLWEKGHARISVRAVLQLTGWSYRYFRKLKDAGLIHRAEAPALGRIPRYWRAEILWLNTPPAERQGPNPVTGEK